MQRKLNEAFLHTYSQEFSSSVTRSFFAGADTISGKEILTLTPSRQVNFFVIRLLFGQWQEEMKRLESPYFNYKNAEVRRAMVDFMNVLSQHIEMEPAAAEQLLQQAVMETLTLAANPAGFVQREFAEREGTLSDKVVKPFLKYIKLYKDDLQAIFAEHQDAPVERLMAEMDAFFDEDLIDEVLADELELLSGVVAVYPEQIYEQPAPEPTPEPELPEPELLMEEEAEAEDPEEDDFFSQLEREEASVFAKEEVAEAEEEQEAPEEEPVVATPPAATRERRETFFDEEPEEEAPEPEEVEIRVAPVPATHVIAERETAPRPPAETPRTAEEAPVTINDQFGKAEKPSLADELEQKKVKSILEGISVNHRYMFTKELFEGDRDAFMAAIDEIETCESFDDAVELIVQDLAKPREWDMNSDEVKELLKVVFRKFR